MNLAAIERILGCKTHFEVFEFAVGPVDVKEVRTKYRSLALLVHPGAR